MVEREEELKVSDLVCVVEHVVDGVVRPPLELILEVLDIKIQATDVMPTIIQREPIETQFLRVRNVLLDVFLRHASNHIVRNT